MKDCPGWRTVVIRVVCPNTTESVELVTNAMQEAADDESIMVSTMYDVVPSDEDLVSLGLDREPDMT